MSLQGHTFNQLHIGHSDADNRAVDVTAHYIKVLERDTSPAKVKYFNGYYTVKTNKREASYRADMIKVLPSDYAREIKNINNSLRDLQTIERHIHHTCIDCA